MRHTRLLSLSLLFVLATLLAGCRAHALVRDRETPRRYTPAELSAFAGVERPGDWQSLGDAELRQSVQQALQGGGADRLRSGYPRLVEQVERFDRVCDRFQVPVQGRLSSPFGFRMHPVYHRLALHTGVDISARESLPITAAGNGEVVFADEDGAEGLKVVIDHGDGITTAYSHASQLMVRVGSTVTAGQVIALVGRTGLATGSHLHLEVRVDNQPKDPLFFLPGLRRLGWENARYQDR